MSNGNPVTFRGIFLTLNKSLLNAFGAQRRLIFSPEITLFFSSGRTIVTCEIISSQFQLGRDNKESTFYRTRGHALNGLEKSRRPISGFTLREGLHGRCHY